MNIPKIKPRTEFLSLMSLLSLVTIVVLVYNENRRSLFTKLIHNKAFILMVAIIFAISVYTLKIIKGEDKKTKRIKTATKQGLIAFIISVMSYLDLKAGPFFIVWITSYYLHLN